MRLVWLTHSDCLAHETPAGHPEQVARLAAVHDALSGEAFEAVERVEALEASDAHILRAHPRAHLDAVSHAAPRDGIVQLDPDTWMSPGSLRAARLSAGAGVQAVDMVLGGAADRAFVATRPPGHHAERQTPMGFCLFGNIAIAAKHALDAHGLERVAIVDFDVHHGNGTQDLLWDDERVLFISTHQVPLYPGTGAAEERGAHGNVLNIPLPPESDGAFARDLYSRRVIPALDAFAPQLVLISAGFDAHARDPLAQLYWEEEDYVWLTREICAVATRHAGGRVVSMLEGGYDLPALAASVAAHVGAMKGDAG
ncbi:MAG: histone deacetylase family protein [Rubricella sp.]